MATDFYPNNVVEQLITENDNNYQQVALENCGGVIIMKLEISQLRWKHINTYSKGKCEVCLTTVIYRSWLIVDYCIFISGEWNVLSAIFSLVIVVITVV